MKFAASGFGVAEASAAVALLCVLDGLGGALQTGRAIIRVAGACPICGAEVDPAGRPLCARCRTEARKLAQPIDGYQIVRVIGKGGWALFTRASASRMAARWQ